MKGYLDPEAVMDLINYARDNQDQFKKGYWIFLRILWVTGARVSEILGDESWYKDRVYPPVLREDYLQSEGVLVLSLLKRKAYPPPRHRVSLDRKTQQILDEYILNENVLPKDPLFIFNRDSALYYLRKLGRLTGHEYVGEKLIHPHIFRHSHCIRFIRVNNTLEGLRKLQTRIGHANINTTAHYLQFGPQSRKETQEVFGQF